MSEATTEAVLQNLKEQGITTLEQLVESRLRTKPPQRSTPAEAEVETSGQTPEPYRSTIGAPDPSVALVLDGKRVDYDAVAQLSDRPLGYIATTLEGGKRALVITSDQSVVCRPLVQSMSQLGAIKRGVEKTLVGAGLTPGVEPLGSNIGVRIYEDVGFSGDSTTIAPESYIRDLRDFRAGREIFDPHWGDAISSLVMLGRCSFQAWEMRDRWGASFFTTESEPDLGVYGWNDDFSSLETFFVN